MKAVLLAAGKGTRMGALTDDLPKPMLPVEGKPILEHIISGIAAQGVCEFCLITEMLFDDLGFPAGDEANVDNAGLSQATQNVFQDGLAFDPKHGLGGFLGQGAHAGPLSCCQDDCFHDLSPRP